MTESKKAARARYTLEFKQEAARLTGMATATILQKILLCY